MKALIWLLHLSIFVNIDGANILALFPLPLFSHTNTFIPVFKELRSRGHNITMLSPYPQKQPLSNWTDIVIDKKPLDTYLEKVIVHLSEHTNVHLLILNVWRFCAEIMEIAYKDESFQKLIKDDNLNFDLVISEPLYAQESLVAFGHKLSVPVVSVFPFLLSPWASYMSGNPLFLPYLPHFRTTYSDDMSFIERIDNTLISILEVGSGLLDYLPKQEKLMEKYMVYSGSENRPSLTNMLKNISLHLIDYHYSVGYIQPLQPNIIPVGGLSLKNAGELPNDLQKYMDNSVNGVIYMSFGSHMPVSSLEKTSLDAILTIFKGLDVNVLMKWENDTMENKPDNVEIRKWFPQASILAHSKCRLFITHGGIHSITEASYHGVPLVIIPFFADQEYNGKFARKAGFAYLLKREDLTKDTFKLAVESVLNKKSYKENAIKRSQITSDRPMPPLETAVYWIEYVLRHKDVSHLKPGSMNLSIYQLFLYDVVLVFVVLVIIILLVIYKLIKLLAQFFLRMSGRTKTKKD